MLFRLDVPQQQADLQKVASEISGSVLTVDITSEDAAKKSQKRRKSVAV